jgi:hypothetical protein
VSPAHAAQPWSVMETLISVAGMAGVMILSVIA